MGKQKTKKTAPIEADPVVDAIQDLMQSAKEIEERLSKEDAMKKLRKNVWTARLYLVCSALSPQKKGDIMSFSRDYLMNLIQLEPNKRELFYYYMKRMRSLGVAYPKKVKDSVRLFILSRDNFDEELLKVASQTHQLSKVGGI